MLGLNISLGIGGGQSIAILGPSGPAEAATADAVSALAYLDDDSSDHVKNTIFQYVYNESISGRWQHMTRLWVARTNLASAYTCIKTGSVATPSATFGFAANDGVEIPTGGSVDFNFDALSEFGVDAYDDFCVGTAISAFDTSGTSSSLFVRPILTGQTAASLTSLEYHYNGGTGGTSRFYANLGIPTARGPANETAADAANRLIRIDINTEQNKPQFRFDEYTDNTSAWGGPLAGYMPVDLIQNAETAGAVTSQTWNLTYVASSALDWETFRDNTNAMLDELLNGEAVANATTDANAAVARLDDDSSDHVKNTIFQYVYNESFGGRWQHIKRMYVPRTNLESAYTCIKTGTTATPTVTLTHTTGGINIADGESVDLNYDLSSDFSDIEDFCFGTAVESFTTSGSNNNPTLFAGTDGFPTVMALGWQDNNNYWSGNLGGATSTQSNDATQLENGYNTIFRIDAALNGSAVLTTRTRYKDQTGTGSWASNSTFFADNLIQNSAQAVGGLAQVWAMTYVAHADLDWETFRDNTNIMLDVLTQSAPAFSAPLTDGDSLEIDDDWYVNPPWTGAPYTAGYRGWLSALTKVSIDDMYVNGYPGKSLKQIASTNNASNWSLDLAIAANSDADSLIIGGGINDITNAFAPIDDIATIEGYVDDIFDLFDAASNLKHIMFREMTATGGRWTAQNDPATQISRWQPYTDQLNAYIATKVTAANTANPGSAFIVEAYAATESSVPAYAGYQEGIIKGTGGNPDTSTGGTTGDGDLTIEGVHYKQSGANIIAALGDIQIANARYFKIVDSYYKGGRPS